MVLLLPYDSTPSLMLFASVWLGVLLIVFAFSVVCYVLSSLGLYTIAKRRGIPAYGLAWVPLANFWIVGAIADHYDFAVKGLGKKQRVLLLCLGIVYVVLTGVFAGLTTRFALRITYYNSAFPPSALVPFLVGMLAFLAVAVVTTVFLYIAYYKIFKSCDPEKATVFTVLSILFSVTLPFFIFSVRNRDLGLYPPAATPGYGGQQN